MKAAAEAKEISLGISGCPLDSTFCRREPTFFCYSVGNPLRYRCAKSDCFGGLLLLTAAPLLNNKIQSREYNQRQQSGREETSNNNHSQRFLYFRSDSVGKRHWKQPEHSQQRGHQNGAQPHERTDDNRIKKADIFRPGRHRSELCLCTFDGCFGLPYAGIPELVEITDHNYSVQHRLAEQRNEADGRRHT